MLGHNKTRWRPLKTSTSNSFFLFNWAHKLRSFGLARIATKRAKRGNKATTTSSWVKIKPLRATSAAQIKARLAFFFSIFFLFLTGAHKLQSFGLAGTATKRAKGGYKATTASSWVKVKPLRAKSAAQIKTRRAPNADSNGR
ncbi:BQ5605_C024g09847 [Microbotryum silenes-dioicae]|uniref:BQ5605_C024g09847 protein n=1 Tax=Microbotryum silenes-dioicae TaxID=796604 RepID=A0A2X0N801_9BASI|nr:BQ5605_C024g09847 [Microbotryum silenes-dioicae]